MPPLKNPPTLYTASFDQTRTWIHGVAISIYNNYGDLDNPRCQDAVNQFNQLFVSNVPAHIIDELFNSPVPPYSVISCGWCNSVPSQLATCNYCNSMPFQIQIVPIDSRILITMHVNPNMKNLNAQRFVNDAFWKSVLPSLKNLIRLDLNKVCTDEILEVVGKHCWNLEFINIVSKSCHTRAKDRHNALKLQLCVSDVGLDFLSSCKELKEIVMTCVIRKGCGGRQVTNEGLKRLLLSLPKLRKINYTDTGVLLDHIATDGNTLSLISVTDYHPAAQRIHKIEKLCPYLSELHLTYAFSSEDIRDDVMSVLICSAVNVSTLSLTNFSFDFTLKRYLEVKGIHLKVFKFCTCKFHVIEELITTLGWNCPNLESLDLNFNFCGHFHLNSCSVLNSYLDKSQSQKFFFNLHYLKIDGINLDFNIVLPLILKQAIYIKKITVDNHLHSACLDEALQTIQQTNPFHRLETICFSKGLTVSVDFLRTFVMSCSALRFVQLESETSSYYNLVLDFSKELSRKNLDVRIDLRGYDGW